jgi:competence protein ComEC
VRREPLLLPAVALALGILAAHFVPLTLRQLLLPTALAVLIGGLTFFPVLRRLRLGALFALFALAGVGTQLIHKQGKTPHLDAADGDTVLLDGCIINPPVFSPDREQMTVALGSRSAIRLSVVLKATQALPLSYGQRIEFSAKVRTPHNFQNPEAFDYAGYLANQHIYWTGSIASPSNITVLPGNCGWRAAGWLYGIRTWALKRLQTLYPNDQHTLGLLQATLLGETSGTERRWTNAFRITGTYHAIVISGLHIWILSASILLLLNLLQVRRLPALSIATAVSWIYAFLCGGNAPVIRAAAGFTLFLVASCFFRKTRILNLLAIVAIIYLTVAPEQLFDPAFQLSFLSAAAIACFAMPLLGRYIQPLQGSVKRFSQVRYDPLLEPRAASWRVEFRLLAQTLQVWTHLPLKYAQTLVVIAVKGLVFAAEMTLVSACVQFGLALPMISYFHRMSVTSLSANVVVVPLLTLVVPTGFVAILTGWHWIAWLTALLLHWAEAANYWNLRWEPSWRIAAVPLSIALAFSAALVVLGFVTRHVRRLILPAFAIALVLFGLIYFQPWKALVQPGTLEITAIDVGQGDSILVIFPNGKTLLVDAGGVPGMEHMVHKPQMDVGEDVVSPYLWTRYIHHLDYVALTHGHSDHMAGMGAVLDNFHPAVFWTGVEPPTREWLELANHAKQNHVSIEHFYRGGTDLLIGGASVHVLAPYTGYTPADGAKNDDSLVLEITYGKRSVLLTGDAERPIERNMLASGELHAVTLLKVGHHGSHTSSSQDFLDQITPQFAFISDGYLNQFHHPNQVVLDRLTGLHTTTLRTDQNGLLMFRTDGDKVQVQSFH